MRTHTRVRAQQWTSIHSIVKDIVSWFRALVTVKTFCSRLHHVHGSVTDPETHHWLRIVLTILPVHEGDIKVQEGEFVGKEAPVPVDGHTTRPLSDIVSEEDGSIGMTPTMRPVDVGTEDPVIEHVFRDQDTPLTIPLITKRISKFTVLEANWIITYSKIVLIGDNPTRS